MAGFSITTDLEEKKALLTARDVAQDQGYSIERLDDWTFQATKGNFALSTFLGAFIAYCNFKVEILEGKYDGETDIVITRNTPWWTGAIGIHRVKNRAKELAEALAAAIEEIGSQVIKEKEF